MVWFRNSIADSCSNLKRSRTELLASMSNATCNGRLVSAWKLRSSAGGLLSSTNLKSSCFKSVMCLPCLSVTVNTTLTSLVGTRMVRTASPEEAGSAGFCAGAAAGVLAPSGGGWVGCDWAGVVEVCAVEAGAAGVGAGDCANALAARTASASSPAVLVSLDPKVSI